MGTDQSSSKLGEARLLKKAVGIADLIERPLLRIPQANVFRPNETFEAESSDPDYDPAVQLILVAGSRILFKSENADMKGGYEIEMGTIVQVNMPRGFILIRWDAEADKRKNELAPEGGWIKKYKLPLTKDFSLV